MYNRIMEVLASRSDEFSKKISYLLNSQKNQIENLHITTGCQRSRIEQLSYMFDALSRDVENREYRAVEKFARKLKERMRSDDDCKYDCEHCSYSCKDYVPIVDNLVKEVVGDN